MKALDTQTGKKVTIDEVASKCGVSKTTISRFLNGKFENISIETRERIKRVINDLDYRPNRSAQRLKASNSMLIGCVVGDIGSPFSALLLKGITSVCDTEGYQVLFADCDDDPAKELSVIEGFLANRVDGLVVNTSGGNDEKLLALRNSGIPIVLADRCLLQPGLIDTVAVPNHKTAYDCVKVLKEYGYAHVAFFSEGNLNITTRYHRFTGFCQAVKDFYIGDEPEYYEFVRDDMDCCLEQIMQFRARHQGERIAILSVNGVTTQRILLAFAESGLEIGADYGLCGFDDWSWLKLASPGITSVAFSAKDLGSLAARLLIDRITGLKQAGAPAGHVEVPANLIIRGSTVKI